MTGSHHGRHFEAAGLDPGAGGSPIPLALKISGHGARGAANQSTDAGVATCYAADRCTARSADGGAAQRSLLLRGHVGAGSADQRGAERRR